MSENDVMIYDDEWVELGDYRALEADNAALRQSVDTMTNAFVERGDEIDALRTQLAAAEGRLKGIEELIREVDILASKETDAEGWIISYRFNTGAWHRLLGVVNGAEIPQHIKQLLEVRVTDALSRDTGSEEVKG